MKSQENAKGVNVRSNPQEPQNCKHAIRLCPFGIAWHIRNLTNRESQCKVEKHGWKCSKFTPKTN